VSAGKRVPGQTSLDDLGVPLSQVTFVVIDLETTGGSPRDCAITELAAARYEGGVCTGTFATLINPGVDIPPFITYLTGITQDMVGPAPRIESVLPTLLEFIGDAIIVGHNVRFDISFLDAALKAHHYPTLASRRRVDTCTLARRLVRSEVANCKLGTLSAHFAFRNQPTHRALDDVRATADLLFLLLERAASFGILGLDDLTDLPAINRHPQAHKLALTNALPRTPGVYLFRDRNGTVIYVGKATNLRSRVRSYFSTDDRRKIGPMLEILHRVDHVECATAFEAAVLEVRLIQRELPRFNRQAKLWTKYAYIRLTLSGSNVTIATTRDANLGAARYLGPFSSLSAARMAALALKEAIALLGTSGQSVVDLLDRPDELLAPLNNRMRTYASNEEFEQAALLRDRAGILARSMHRQRVVAGLRSAGWLEVQSEGRIIRIDHGRVRFGEGRADPTKAPATTTPVPCHLIDELTIVATWLEKKSTAVSIVHADSGLAWPVHRPPRFEVREPDEDGEKTVRRHSVVATATTPPTSSKPTAGRSTRPRQKVRATPGSTPRGRRESGAPTHRRSTPAHGQHRPPHL
jgi:DNA polymerase III subunit epsilon